MEQLQSGPMNLAIAKFIGPDWGDKVDSGIWLSNLLARLHFLAGRYVNPMPEKTTSPVRDYEFSHCLLSITFNFHSTGHCVFPLVFVVKI